MFNIKIASVSCNQTGGDWPNNLTNIFKAIDQAVTDGVDLLAFEELTISGYDRGDDFLYSDNRLTQHFLQLIADYAASKDPNLVLSIGHPWYFADKELPDQMDRRKNPLYNRTNNQFNVQSFVANGEVIAMSAKRYLFNYERGYEKRHFEEWNDRLANEYQNEFGQGREGTIFIELPKMTYPNDLVVPAKVIPFGSPVIQVGRGEKKFNLTHEICEGIWVGSAYDFSTSHQDYDRDNPIAQKSRLFDLNVVLNPTASPPAANKSNKQCELAKLASRYCDVVVMTDGLGSSGSTYAQFGSRIMAQNEKIISFGARASFKDFAYTSQIVTVKNPLDKGHEPHAVIEHQFANAHSPAVQDTSAWEFLPDREIEEELRIETLWLFDYMRKNNIQGITQALSGGADSAYNAAKVRLMVELVIAERGLEGFLDALPSAHYREAVLQAYQVGNNVATAVDVIMDNILTCVYMGTDNSSEETLRAARSLVEGGTDADGVAFKGIGGKFHYRNVQRLVDVYAQIYAGVNPSRLSHERDAQIREEIASLMKVRKEDTTPEELENRITVLKYTFEEVMGEVLSTANDKHAIPYENLQARLRQVLIMMFTNVENKVAISNPNLDEGRNSYATWGGDLQSGMISGNAHKPKQRQLDHMAYLHRHGLDGITPVHGFYWTLLNRPSAELQPKSKDGKVTQFDEDQLGRTFTQMNVISYYMLLEQPHDQHGRKNSPLEVFEKCRQHPAFKDDSLETLHDRIRLSYEKWAQAQYKIHGSPVAFTYGESVDHQTSLRTPNINAFHSPELAALAIHCLKLMAARDGVKFDTLTQGNTAESCSQRIMVDKEFSKKISSKMWTPQATDGRKMKISSLYSHLKTHGFSQIAAPTQMSDFLFFATQFRQAKNKRDALSNEAVEGENAEKRRKGYFNSEG